MSMQAHRIGAGRNAVSCDDLRTPRPPLCHVLPRLPIRWRPRMLCHLSTFAGVFFKLIQKIHGRALVSDIAGIMRGPSDGSGDGIDPRRGVDATLLP